MIIALIPAHNEELGIAQTLQGLRAQSKQPDLVLVVADNCTDRTVPVAVANGAEVFVTRGNTDKKAGALNQALGFLLTKLDDQDLILIQDADTVLSETFIEEAEKYVAQFHVVSGAYRAVDLPGWLQLLQRTEFEQERFRVARRGGRVSVLSGTSSVFSVGLLREVSAQRGDSLPGRPGDIYDSNSLTEDFELTLAIKRLGYRLLSPSCLSSITDVMRTVPALYGQRLRWQRGTLETLWQYPLRMTWRMWGRQIGNFAVGILPVITVALLGFLWIAAGGVEIDWRWQAVIPLVAASEAYSARGGGRRTMLVAGAIVPLALYGAFRNYVYWRALGAALWQRSSAWT